MTSRSNGKQKSASQVIRALKNVSNPEKAEFFPRFFKCGPGEYGEGDRFLGVTVPNSRKIALAHSDLSLREVKALLSSKWHEARLTGLLILVQKFKSADPKERAFIYSFYLSNKKHVNNWDLVDTSAPYIAGPVLFEKYASSKSGGREVLSFLLKLSKSKSLWDRRIAILTTFYFIRHNEFRPTLLISEKLLNDEHDLIHKAVGWMLREVGNRSRVDEEEFLKRHSSKMPRAMLRYAIERFPSKLRSKYLA